MSALRILYVDDEADIREVATLALALDPGIECRVFESGAAAIAMVQEEAWRPDLVLLDVMMPLMDGPTTMTALKALPACATAPIVFMTARAQGHEQDRFIRLGAAAVIAKPFDPMSLARQLRAVHHAALAA